jgi:crotonobetainyl-CoA:carnitine CoA-transferase CaiB-like acyl-CoA transferase
VKSPEDALLLERLLARADVFLHNLAPGAVDRLGFDTERLRATHPRLITCQISGYGTDGPDRDRKAYDLLVQGETGLVSSTGSPEAAARAGISAADIAAGMYAYSSTLAALLRRERTGQGAVIEVSMLEALAEWMGQPLYTAMNSGAPLPRTATAHPVIAPYDAYPTADGDLVLISVQNDREWRRLVTAVLGRPELLDDDELATNVGRVRNRERVDYLVTKVTSAQPTAELQFHLDEARIANARLNDLDQLADHPQLAYRKRWREVDSAVGPLGMLLPPATLKDVEPRMDAIPRLGEHTDDTLARLGYSPADITDLRKDGVIA